MISLLLLLLGLPVSGKQYYSLAKNTFCNGTALTLAGLPADVSSHTVSICQSACTTASTAGCAAFWLNVTLGCQFISAPIQYQLQTGASCYANSLHVGFAKPRCTNPLEKIKFNVLTDQYNHKVIQLVGETTGCQYYQFSPQQVGTCLGNRWLILMGINF